MAGFFKSLLNKINNRPEIDWDELEAELVSADLGIRLATSIIDELRGLGREVSGEDVVEVTRRQLAERLDADFLAPTPTPRRYVSTPTRKPSPTRPTSSSAAPPAASTPATT